MNGAPENSAGDKLAKLMASIPDYRTLILKLETPFPENGVILAARQIHCLKHILKISVLVGNLADELKRNIFYFTKGNLKPETVSFISDAILAELHALTQPIPVQDRRDLRVSKKEIRLIHSVLGLITEPAEYTDSVEQLLFHFKEFDTVNAKEELSDCRWYMELAYDVLRTTDEEVRTINTRKLLTRYPGKFSADAAVNRDTDAERKVLSQPTQS